MHKKFKILKNLEKKKQKLQKKAERKIPKGIRIRHCSICYKLAYLIAAFRASTLSVFSQENSSRPKCP